MESFSQFFQKINAQVRAFWLSLSGPKRIALLATGGVMMTGLVLIITAIPQKEYEYLFVNMSPADSSEIISFLKKSNFNEFIIDDKGLKVPSESVARLRIQLSQQGLPAQGIVGWEKFDNSDFTRTDFEQKIHKIRAIQGELQRTITQIDGIEQARVHIVVPKTALFTEDKNEPTAAIYVKSRRGSKIEQKTIQGIVHLVSRSVEGLSEENISIINFDGKLLTEEKSNDPGSRQTKEMLEHTRSIEKNLEERIRSIVGRVVGIERVEAKVDVTVDYTRIENTISEVDPDKVAPISTYTSVMDLTGTGLNPTGIPGSKSNVPGEQEALNVMSSQTKNNRNNERMNYEVSKKISHQVMPLGTIKRISAAVLVDGKQAIPVDGAPPQFEARSEEEMNKIQELVQNAIGYTEGRDQVSLQNMLFQLDHTQVEAISVKKKEEREYITTLAVASTIALALVMFFAFIVRPYFRWLAYDPERRHSQSIVEEFKPDLELGSMHKVQIKEDVPFEKLTPQEQVFYLAKHEPQRTTEAIRIVLNPHHTASI